MISPTQRTLAECRKRGYIAQVVERFNPHAHVRVDLFGVIDIVAITPAGILGIQACAGSSHAARRDKILAEPRVKAWLEAGGRMEIWSWAKQGATGARKRWTLRAESIEVADMPKTGVSVPAAASEAVSRGIARDSQSSRVPPVERVECSTP
jgi:hypothetical protein